MADEDISELLKTIKEALGKKGKPDSLSANVIKETIKDFFIGIII